MSGIAFLVGVFSNLSQVAALRIFMGTFYGTELHFGIFLGIWLGGVALGGILGGYLPISLNKCLLFLGVSPFISIFAFWYGLKILPAMTGSYLPIFPVFIYMCIAVFPLSLPIGLFIPSALSCGKRSLGAIYSFDAFGGFAGGLIFSLLLGGLVPSYKLLGVLPILLFSAGTMLPIARKTAGFLALAWGLFSLFILPNIEKTLEQNCWNHFHPGYKLEISMETPYQWIQIGDYEKQKSLFQNGSFSGAWPDQVKAEERVHEFLTAVKEPKNVLVLGPPTPDLIFEFQKYPNLRTTFVELDSKLLEILASGTTSFERISLVGDDPRAFLRNTTNHYDGILVLPSDPTTIVSNRLFTREAFADMSRNLTTEGIVSIGVSGTENYLGNEMEQTILSTHLTLLKVFPEVFAVPGDPILFWATKEIGNLATEPEILAKRFTDRAIPTLSFKGLSFFNILLPFRVEEIRNWLHRDVSVSLNEDTHPKAFIRQLLMWDIYSGSKMGFIFEKFENLSLSRTLLLLCAVFIIILAILFLLSNDKVVTVTGAISAAVSGGGGLLCEIILILLYQNRHGAMFKMAGFFFGVYMLGLTFGASIAGKLIETPLKSLKKVKFLQICLTVIFIQFTQISWIHSAIFISMGIFFSAFLAGIEFPILDGFLRQKGFSRKSSAGFLLFGDNCGALFIGLLTGFWILPILGMNGGFICLTLAFLLNLALLYRIPVE